MTVTDCKITCSPIFAYYKAEIGSKIVKITS